MAAEPELLERSTTAKTKRQGRRRGPTIASLRAKVDRAKRGSNGPDIGPMSHSQRIKLLLGF